MYTSMVSGDETNSCFDETDLCINRKAIPKSTSTITIIEITGINSLFFIVVVVILRKHYSKLFIK